MQVDLSAMDSIETGDTQASAKSKVDVVFVIDNSGSMSSVINGVKNHINTFVNSLETNDGNDIDYRIGFVMHGNDALLIKSFTNNASDFQQAMSDTKNHDTGFDEFGLPAIDIASDFPWEENRHKFIIIFTDESTRGGHESDYQMSKLDELVAKLGDKKIKIYYLGVDAEDYREFRKIPNTYYEPNDDFERVDFSKLLETIGKSVSQASGTSLQGGQGSYGKDIYDVESYVKIINL